MFCRLTLAVVCTCYLLDGHIYLQSNLSLINILFSKCTKHHPAPNSRKSSLRKPALSKICGDSVFSQRREKTNTRKMPPGLKVRDTDSIEWHLLRVRFRQAWHWPWPEVFGTKSREDKLILTLIAMLLTTYSPSKFKDYTKGEQAHPLRTDRSTGIPLGH
jgi:hypothetical protein